MISRGNFICRSSAVLSAVVLLAVQIFTAQAQDPGTSPPQTNEATILLTAVDKDLHFVKILRAEDLRVFENGKPQNVVGFRQVSDQSVSLAILIDASASQEQTLPAQKLAATSFVDQIIRPDKDEAAVGTFTG